MSTDVIPFDQALQIALTALTAILGGLVTSPFVTFITGVLKFVVPSVKPELLQVGTAIVVMVAYWLGDLGGFSPQLDALTKFILVAGGALITLGSSLFGSTVVYKTAKALSVPVLGYKPIEHQLIDAAAKRAERDPYLKD